MGDHVGVAPARRRGGAPRSRSASRDGRLHRDAEVRRLAREDRVAAPGPQLQVREVAPRVQHRDARHAHQREGEHEPERQRVVDRRDEQHQHREARSV